MKLLRKDYYKDNISNIQMKKLDVTKLKMNESKHTHNSGNTL